MGGAPQVTDTPTTSTMVRHAARRPSGAHMCSYDACQDDCATEEHAAEAQYHAEAVDGADVAAHGDNAVSEGADSARSPASRES